MERTERETTEKIAQIFMPSIFERTAFIQENRIDFVHYTTAENALNILRSRTVYMRNTVCMNDYREFAHGLEMLADAFRNESPVRKEFFESINSCGDQIAEEAVKLFDDWLPHNEFNVYVTCLSEHDKSEDEHGRLSMWRAYSRPGAVGVALVLNSEPFWQTSTVLQTFGSPVYYFKNDQFLSEFRKVLRNVRDSCEFLRQMPRQLVVQSIFGMLLMTAACSKHVGFAEEREWRLVHLPKQSKSKALIHSIEAISGVPQPIYKIPLKDRIEDGLVNIEPAKLLRKIIIGPSNFPLPIYQAFVTELAEAGVEHAETKVTISSIPLRT